MKSAIVMKIIIAIETLLLIVGVIKFDVIGIASEALKKETSPDVYAEEIENEDIESEEINTEPENNSDVTDPAANIVIKYMESIYNISTLSESEKPSYLANWLMSDSQAYNFYISNLGKLTTADGESIVKNIEIKSAHTLDAAEDILKIKLNEKWVFENGESKEFSNNYIIDKTNKTPIVKEVEMDELKKYISNYSSTEDDMEKN